MIVPEFFMTTCGIATSVLMATIIVLYLYIRRKYNYWERKGVPHTKPKSIIFGNLREVLFKKSTLHKLYQGIYQEFNGEPFCGFFEFQSPVLMIRDPNFIQKVLVENFHFFQHGKGGVGETSDEILPYNPFVLINNRWKDARHIISIGLSSTKLRCLDAFMKPISQEIFSYIDDASEDIEILDLTSKFCCEMLVNFGWGIEGKSFSKNSIVKTMFDYSQSISSSIAISLVMLNPKLSCFLNMRCFPKQLTNFLQLITKQASDASENLNSNQNTFLHSILQIRKKYQEHGKDLTIKEITGYMGTLYLDGYETTARVISYFVYDLMLYPEVQEKMRKEIMKMNEITVESVTKLHYMDMFISEVFRYHSLIPFLGRTCSEKCKLGELEIDAGTAIIVPLCGINQDSNYYPEPEVFNPDNFSDENKANRHRFAQSTFGHGPRMCPGVRYATSIIKLFLSYIVQSYSIVPPKNNEIKPIRPGPNSIFVIIQDEPLYVRFKRR